MSRVLLLVKLAILIAAAYVASAEARDRPLSPHWGWPSAAPMDVVLHRDLHGRSGDGRLPNALVHGPRGVEEVPGVDLHAHRITGGVVVRVPRPMFNGRRLAWCAEEGRCGAVAAQMFCHAHGFGRVLQAEQERHVGSYAETVQLVSGAPCVGPHCHGFSRIVCGRGG
jgi:hypothetical protein